MAWKYVYNLDDAVLPMIPMVSGAAVAAGDALVIDTGKVIKATGGADTVAIKYVAAEAAAAADETILCYPCLPSAVFEAAGGGGTYAFGTKVGITASTLLPDQSDTSNVRVMLVGQDEKTTTLWHFVSLGWLA